MNAGSTAELTLLAILQANRCPAGAPAAPGKEELREPIQASSDSMEVPLATVAVNTPDVEGQVTPHHSSDSEPDPLPAQEVENSHEKDGATAAKKDFFSGWFM